MSSARLRPHTPRVPSVQGMESYCVRSYAEALEVVPYTLAENAGLNPIQIVTELRNLHANGAPYHGINVKKVRVGCCVRRQISVHSMVVSGIQRHLGDKAYMHRNGRGAANLDTETLQGRIKQQLQASIVACQALPSA